MAETTVYYEVVVRKVTKVTNVTETSGGNRVDVKSDSDEIYSQSVLVLDLPKLIGVVNGLVKPEPPKQLEEKKP